MNWRLIVAVFLIFTSIAAIAVFSYRSLQVAEQVKAQLEDILAADSFEQMEEKVRSFAKHSKRDLAVFGYVCDKSVVREMEILVYAMQSASMNADEREIRRNAQQLLVLLEVTVRAQKPITENIF